MANQFLLHFDGSDTSTTFTNIGTEADDFTAYGNAQLDTAQKQFGSASGLFDPGTSDYVENASDWAFNTGSPGWTMEFWVRFNSMSGSPMLVSAHKNGNGFGVNLYKNGASNLILDLSSAGVSNDLASAEPGSKTSWSTGQWYHIAMVRDVANSAYYVYVDGTLDITVSTSTAVSITDLRLTLGKNNAGTIFLNGWLDEFRITDTCEYPGGTGFSVPVAPFTNDVPATFAAHYDFSESTGLVAYDSSGNENHGTLAGTTPTWGSGTVVFPASGGRITLPETLDLELVGDVTFECRFKLNASATGWKALFARNNAGSGAAQTFEVWVNATSGYVDIYSDGSTSGNQQYNHTSASILVDTWYELAIVIDRTAGTIKLYIDGVDSALSSGVIGTDDAVAGTNTDIGYFTGGGYEFYGEIDFVRVYNDALSEAAVEADFAAAGNSGTLDQDLPVLEIEAETGGANLTLPLKTIEAGTNGAELELPVFTISAETQTTGDVFGGIELPLLTIAAAGELADLTLTAGLTLPLFTNDAAGFSGKTSSMVASLPLKTITAGGNHSAYLNLPLLTSSSTIKTGAITNSDIRLPAIIASGESTVSGVYSGTAIKLPLLKAASTINTGSITTAANSLPVLRLQASGFRYNNGTLLAPLKIITLSATGGPAITATSAISLPELLIVASGYNPVAQVYRSWAVNMRKGAISEYNNFDFNSFTEFNGTVLAANGSGIYSLALQDSDDNSEIDALFRTGITGFNTSYLKRIPRLYLGYRSDGPLVFRTITTHDGPRSYRVESNGNTSHHQRRVPIGRGPKSTYWQFEVANESGSDFGVNSMLLYPQVLKRRNL